MQIQSKLKPLISLLMANYNNSKFVGQAISSVINQTYPNWELIIIDDVSEDDSVAAIKPYLRDKRIKFYKNNDNLGVGITKAKCAEYAMGEILGILDSDDALLPNALEKIAEAYKQNPDCGAIYTNHYWCNNDLNIVEVNTWVGKIDSDKSNLKEIKVHHFLTFKKEIYHRVGGFDGNFLIAEDKDLIYRLEEATKFFYVDEPLYCYRLHEEGISQKNKHKSKNWEIKAQFKAFKRRQDIGMLNLSRNEMSELMYEGLLRSLLILDFKSAGYFFKEAVKSNPNFILIFKVIYHKRKNFKNELFHI